MSTRSGSAFAVLIIGLVLGVAAVAPAHSSYGRTDDFVGTWITWRWAPDGNAGECRRLHVGSRGEGARAGTWNAPGWSGLVTGAVARGSGRTVWAGEWRDGVLAGSFSLTLRGADAIEGTFAGPGEAPQPWSGRRATGKGAPDVPCRSR